MILFFMIETIIYLLLFIVIHMPQKPLKKSGFLFYISVEMPGFEPGSGSWPRMILHGVGCLMYLSDRRIKQPKSAITELRLISETGRSRPYAPQPDGYGTRAPVSGVRMSDVLRGYAWANAKSSDVNHDLTDFAFCATESALVDWTQFSEPASKPTIICLERFILS